MAPAAALHLAFLLLAVGCGAQTPRKQPAKGPAWLPQCKAAAAAQAREMQLADQQGGPKLLFLGDSITEVWRGTFCGSPCGLGQQCRGNPEVIRRYFWQYKPSVQAIAGDQVEHLTWRLNNGALPKKNHPKVAVLLIGINDLSALANSAPGKATPEQRLVNAAPETARRVQSAVLLLRQRLPRTHIVLLGLLPSGVWGLPVQNAHHGWPSHFARALPIVNTQLRAFAATLSNVHYVGCGWRFLNANRTAIDSAMMPDALHPGVAGMERGLAQCIKPLVDSLMRARG